MSDYEEVEIYPIKCDGCQKVMDIYSDRPVIEDVIICGHCSRHPEEVAARIGIEI